MRITFGIIVRRIAPLMKRCDPTLVAVEWLRGGCVAVASAGAGGGGHDDAAAACFVRPVRTLRGQIVRLGVALSLYGC